MLLVADVLDPFQQQGLGIVSASGAPGAVLKLIDVAAKLVQRIECLGRHLRGQAFGEQRLEQAQFPAAGELTQLAQRGVADAALGRGDGAQKSRIVVGVDQKPQPGAEVFDLGPVKKALAARDLVGHVGGAQLFLEDAGQVVGAVQDGEVGVLDLAAGAVVGHRAALGTQAQDEGQRTLGLVLFAVAFDQSNRFTGAVFAPQLFLEQFGVAGDHVVGRAQDVAGGPVVLLQRDHLQAGPVFGQSAQVGDGRAAPAVDRLVVIAHRREATGALRVRVTDQQLEQLVLHRVGVLVLVHQHMPEPCLPLGSRGLVALQQLQRQADQVVEIHRLVGRQPLFIQLHHPGRHLLVGVLGGSQRSVAVQALVLPQADGPLPLTRQLVVGGRAGVAHHAHHVVAVQNREPGLEPHGGPVFAQDAHAQAVEGADCQVFGGAPAHQALGPLAHLLRGLVGEGDRRDLLGRQPGLQQPRDLVHDHPRLARARAGQHQTRPVQVVHGLQLRGVERGGGFGHEGRG